MKHKYLLNCQDTLYRLFTPEKSALAGSEEKLNCRRPSKTLKSLTALLCYNASTLLNKYGNMYLDTKYT